MSFDVSIIFEKNKSLFKLLNSIKSEKTKLYLVGGYLRDLFFNKESLDRDFIVDGQCAVDFARKVADKLDGYFVLLDRKNDIARVVLKDKIRFLDFASCVGKDVLEDLKRRDFTINSLAYDVQNAKIIDTQGGLDDLKNKIIRTCNLDNMTDDSLRILRAFRFSAQLGFKIEKTLFDFILKNKQLINKPAKERINVELMKLLEGNFAYETLVKMKESEFIFELFPDLKKQLKVPPNLHHHLGLMDHSLECVNQIEILIKNLSPKTSKIIFSDFFNTIKRSAFLKLGALLHDIGKFDTWTIEEDTGRHRFIGHEEVGVNLATPILKELKFSNNSIKYITTLIKYHIYPSQLLKEPNVSDKAILRLFRKLGEFTPDVILLAAADRLSARGPEITDDIVKENIDGLKKLLKRYFQESEKIQNIPKLLSGIDVMKILNVQRGPKVGKILAKLNDAQLVGDVKTKDEAVCFIKNMR